MDNKGTKEKKKSEKCCQLNKKENVYSNMLRDKYIMKSINDYIKENRKHLHQNMTLFSRLYSFLLISTIFLFQSSLCETNNKVIFQMPATTSTSKVTVVSNINEVESMKINDDEVEIAKKITPLLGVDYEVTIYFKPD